MSFNSDAYSFGSIKNSAVDYFTPMLTMVPSLASTIKENKLMTEGPLIYFAIAGSMTIIASIFAILLIYEVLGKESRLFFFRLIAGLLIVSLIFEFCAGVYTSLMVQFYNFKFEAVLNMSQDSINALTSQLAKDYYNSIRGHYPFTMAEAIVSLAFAVPALLVVLFALLDDLVNENSVNGSSKVAPGNIPLQEKTQVEPFHGSLEFVGGNGKK